MGLGFVASLESMLILVVVIPRKCEMGFVNITYFDFPGFSNLGSSLEIESMEWNYISLALKRSMTEDIKAFFCTQLPIIPPRHS